MPKLPATFFFLILIFLVTFGLAISLRGVFGLNIAGTLTGPLNLGGNKITNVGAPTISGDAATLGTVNSAVAPLQTRVSGTCPVGHVILIINADGSVVCS